MPAGYAALVTIEESCGVRFESTALRFAMSIPARQRKLLIRAAAEPTPQGGRQHRESTKSAAGGVVSIRRERCR